MAYLEYLVQGMRQEFKLTRAVTTIGRADDAVLQLEHDPEVSRHHCTIRKKPEDVFTVADEKATNGTFLNGNRLVNQELPLRDLDKIVVGQTTLVFRDQEVGLATALFDEVAGEMDKGKGFGTILHDIVKKKKER